MKASDAKAWFEFLKSFRIEHLIIFILAIALVYLLVHPDKVLVWKGILQSFLIFSQKAQKDSICNRVCGSIRHATKQMPEEERALFPETVKIEWKDGENETRESFLNGNQVIVRMCRTDNIHKTTSIAALEMAKAGVLANGKRYMNADVSQASDYLVARKLISNISSGQSLGYFDEMYFRPQYDSNAEFRQYFDQLITTDHNGMYVSVFLNETRKMADLLFPEPANVESQKDNLDFLRFLYNLCVRNNDASFRYVGKYIKVDVAFTGDLRVLRSQGYDFYVRKCYDALYDRINTVYIFAIGMRTQDAMGVEDLFNEQHPNFANTKRTPYIHVFPDQRKKHGICIEFQKIAE